MCFHGVKTPYHVFSCYSTAIQMVKQGWGICPSADKLKSELWFQSLLKELQINLPVLGDCSRRVHQSASSCLLFLQVACFFSMNIFEDNIYKWWQNHEIVWAICKKLWKNAILTGNGKKISWEKEHLSWFLKGQLGFNWESTGGPGLQHSRAVVSVSVWNAFHPPPMSL